MQLTFDPNPTTDLDRIDDRELSLFDTAADRRPSTVEPNRRDDR